jgi:hypothetical protein
VENPNVAIPRPAQKAMKGNFKMSEFDSSHK